jgi:adenylyltransferase/sulfurtransferase
LIPECPTNAGSCSEQGVVSMAPTISGQLAAMEAVKLILGVDSVLNRRMILMDGLSGSFKTV